MQAGAGLKGKQRAGWCVVDALMACSSHDLKVEEMKDYRQKCAGGVPWTSYLKEVLLFGKPQELLGFAGFRAMRRHSWQQRCRFYLCLTKAEQDRGGPRTEYMCSQADNSLPRRCSTLMSARVDAVPIRDHDRALENSNGMLKVHEFPGRNKVEGFKGKKKAGTLFWAKSEKDPASTLANMQMAVRDINAEVQAKAKCISVESLHRYERYG
ncbi:hypothetical protein NDU88_002070 [Pleurodeles waltl]|uniref:Uncharacterized protein n=1 Tax=Pleurodeles waltl TaxID=8319 RepID=A0AAV7W0U4_PLEWA|nr:hypothetical protein NDU88_002070 [Pleurodeles waltl]